MYPIVDCLLRLSRNDIYATYICTFYNVYRALKSWKVPAFLNGTGRLTFPAASIHVMYALANARHRYSAICVGMNATNFQARYVSSPTTAPSNSQDRGLPPDPYSVHAFHTCKDFRKFFALFLEHIRISKNSTILRHNLVHGKADIMNTFCTL